VTENKIKEARRIEKITNFIPKSRRLKDRNVEK